MSGFRGDSDRRFDRGSDRRSSPESRPGMSRPF
jgi:hypothetical protein